MKVEQFYSKNQFHLYGEGKHIFQSYDSKVVEVNYEGGHYNVILGRDWDYSTTTSKYVYLFLEEFGDINFYGITNKREYVRKLIKEGKIIEDIEMY